MSGAARGWADHWLQAKGFVREHVYGVWDWRVEWQVRPEARVAAFGTPADVADVGPGPSTYDRLIAQLSEPANRGVMHTRIGRGGRPPAPESLLLLSPGRDVSMHPEQNLYPEKTRAEVYPFLPAHAVTFLDVGCSSGGFGRTIKANRGAKAVVVGIEPMPDAASLARDAGYAEVLEGHFPDVLESSGRTFDCIVFNDVLEHMIDPWSVVAASRRFLAPGGAVIASIPSIRYLPVLYMLIRGHWDYADWGTLDRTHLRFFTKATMVEMFEDAGFVVERVQGINTEWELTRLRRLKRFRRLAGDFQWLQFALVCRLPEQ